MEICWTQISAAVVPLCLVKSATGALMIERCGVRPEVDGYLITACHPMTRCFSPELLTGPAAIHVRGGPEVQTGITVATSVLPETGINPRQRYIAARRVARHRRCDNGLGVLEAQLRLSLPHSGDLRVGIGFSRDHPAIGDGVGSLA